MKQTVVFLLMIWLLVMPTKANVVVEARLDSMTMWIGNQNHFRIEVTAPQEASVRFPICYEDTLVTGLTILSRSPIDSVLVENGRKQLSMDYLFTSFDEGLYYIPPVGLTVDGEPYVSNHLSLKVLTFEVDTTDYQLFDVKGIERPPFVLWDYALYMGIVLGLILITCVLVFVVLPRLKKKSSTLPVDEEELLPPHVAALQALERIKGEKLWQQGRFKDYHTQLSEVLRKYLSRRFEFAAMEMTSSEISRELRNRPDLRDFCQDLDELMQLSDFVKFAKMTPLPEENERSLRTAYRFVEQTSVEEPAEEPSSNELSSPNELPQP